jgi:hypothetical protein
LVEFKNSGKSGMCVVLVVAKMWGGNWERVGRSGFITDVIV